MLPKAAPSVYQAPKCFVTYGSMGHTDTKQLPRRSKPWSNLMGLDFIHRVSQPTWIHGADRRSHCGGKVDVILPQEIYETLRHQLVVETPPPSYYRVTMSLEQVLQGNFFTEYIKRGQYPLNDRSSSSLTVSFTVREHSDAVRGYYYGGQHVHAERRCVIQCTTTSHCSLPTNISLGRRLDYVPG
jgi:ribonuclease P/MRP protein subunit RPP40